MEGKTPAMPIVAQHFDHVIGVDTHTDTHTAVIVTPVGTVIAGLTVPADPAGYQQLIGWAAQFGGEQLWAIDGTRSHGAGLTGHLAGGAQQVTEAARPPAPSRRRGGKSDALDAAYIARAVLPLSVSQLASPRAAGQREALRILLTCRRHDTDTRTATINLFKSLILTGGDDIREHLRGLTITKQARLAATWNEPSRNDSVDTETIIRQRYLAQLAETILTLNHRINTNLQELHTLVTQLCPKLLQQPGVGPVTAAILLTTWSHKGRFRSEAAYAALAGASPIPASSGRTIRMRLNRGGDRTLNTALHTIAICRRQCDPATRDYLKRRTAEGKTSREIQRSLKRYICRQLYRIMQTSTSTA